MVNFEAAILFIRIFLYKNELNNNLQILSFLFYNFNESHGYPSNIQQFHQNHFIWL